MSRDPHVCLLAALADLSGSRPAGLARRGWASATFAGERHRIALSLPAADAAAFAEALPDADFAIPGHLVADIAVIARQDDAATAHLTIEALTLIEG